MSTTTLTVPEAACPVPAINIPKDSYVTVSTAVLGFSTTGVSILSFEHDHVNKQTERIIKIFFIMVLDYLPDKIEKILGNTLSDMWPLWEIVIRNPIYNILTKPIFYQLLIFIILYQATIWV